MSADREGTDLLAEAQKIDAALKADRFRSDVGMACCPLCDGFWNDFASIRHDPDCLIPAFRRAISSEEARRARPEPAGFCSTCRGPVYHRDGTPGEYDHECKPAVEDPRDATIRDLRTLLGQCATALNLLSVKECAVCHGTGKPQAWPLNVCGACIGEGRILWAQQGGATAVVATAAALRSAGVEPTPEAQKGKATR